MAPGEESRRLPGPTPPAHPPVAPNGSHQEKMSGSAKGAAGVASDCVSVGLGAGSGVSSRYSASCASAWYRSGTTRARAAASASPMSTTAFTFTSTRSPYSARFQRGRANRTWSIHSLARATSGNSSGSRTRNDFDISISPYTARAASHARSNAGSSRHLAS